MCLLSILYSRLLEKIATKEEKNIMVQHVHEVIDNTWDDCEDRYLKMSDEEEQLDFIRRMKDLGFVGNSYGGATSFYDKLSPTNVRRKVLEERKKKQLMLFYKNKIS